jgi:hypothetical protein
LRTFIATLLPQANATVHGIDDRVCALPHLSTLTFEASSPPAITLTGLKLLAERYEAYVASITIAQCVFVSLDDVIRLVQVG